jgi:hypothetical protein
MPIAPLSSPHFELVSFQASCDASLGESEVWDEKPVYEACGPGEHRKSGNLQVVFELVGRCCCYVAKTTIGPP